MLLLFMGEKRGDAYSLRHVVCSDTRCNNIQNKREAICFREILGLILGLQNLYPVWGS